MFSRQIEKFSVAAKATHKRYGMSKDAAIWLTRRNAAIVAIMAKDSNTIVMNASPGLCSPKNIGVHAALSANCTKNRVRGLRCAVNPPRFHTSHAAIAIVA